MVQVIKHLNQVTHRLRREIPPTSIRRYLSHDVSKIVTAFQSSTKTEHFAHKVLGKPRLFALGKIAIQLRPAYAASNRFNERRPT